MRVASLPWILASLSLAAAGCKGGDFECTATVDDDNPTVVKVTFDTDDEVTSTVEFTPDHGPTTTTPEVGPTKNHEHLLLGLPADTHVSFTATADKGTCEGDVRTKQLPATFPAFEIGTDQPDKYADPYLLVSFIGVKDNDAKTVAVIDRQGQALWYFYANEKTDYIAAEHPDWDPAQVGSLAVIHAALWPEQKQLLFNVQSRSFDADIGSIFWTNWAKEDLRSVFAPESHHAFALHHDTGVVTYMALDVRQWDDPDVGESVAVAGDAFVDLDANGDTTTLMSTWDVLDVQKNGHWDVEFYPDVHDWTHANATNFFPDRNAFLFSFANINTFMEWSYDTGPGQIYSWENYHPADDGVTTPFTFQHDPRWTPDGDISMTSTTEETHGVVYSFDDATKTYSRVWVAGEGEEIHAFALGENQLLGNGNRLVNYGSACVIQEVAPDGEVVWEMHGNPAHLWIGSVEAFDDFYAYE